MSEGGWWVAHLHGFGVSQHLESGEKLSWRASPQVAVLRGSFPPASGSEQLCGAGT